MSRKQTLVHWFKTCDFAAYTEAELQAAYDALTSGELEGDAHPDETPGRGCAQGPCRHREGAGRGVMTTHLWVAWAGIAAAALALALTLAAVVMIARQDLCAGCWL